VSNGLLGVRCEAGVTVLTLQREEKLNAPDLVERVRGIDHEDSHEVEVSRDH
jgi:hypothetical protein